MKTILATDGSAHSRLAETLALKLPSIAGGEVIVAHALAAPMVGFVGAEPMASVSMASDVDEVFQLQIDQSKRLLEETAARLLTAGCNVKTAMLEGDAVSEIIALAERENADAILIGSRGIGGFEAFFLGSVAKGLAEHSPCSVLIARHAKDASPEETARTLAGKERLVAAVAVDGSDGSWRAVEALQEQGKSSFEAIYSLCAEPLAVLPSGINPTDFPDGYTDDRERVIEILKRADSAFEGYAPLTKGAHRLGAPGDVICGLAEDLQVDLLAIGASRHGFLERLILGSVSQHVVMHAPCSVWVVRPPKA
jgi:nucleotide-binding universal stress UspA family protein